MEPTSDGLDQLEIVPAPGSKSELLARIAIARAALDRTIAAIDATALAKRRDAAGWTALDHLAHIAAWERMIVAHLSDGSDAAVVGVEPARYAAMSLQQINDALHERTLARSAADTAAKYTAAHLAIRTHILAMDDDAFARPYWSDDASGRSTMEKITGDTYRHYLEHRRWIMTLHP